MPARLLRFALSLVRCGALSLFLLAPSQAQTIAFVNPGHADEQFWIAASQAMQMAARSLGVKLEVLYAERQPARALALCRELAARPASQRPDYVIISNERGSLVDNARALAEGGIKSFAAFSGLLPQEQARWSPRRGLPLLLGSLEPRAQDAGYLTAKALIQQGLQGRRPGHGAPLRMLALAGDRTTPSSIQRSEGMRRALAEHPEVELRLQLFANWRRDEAAQLMRSTLQKSGSEAPQLVWAGSDQMAFGAMEAAEAQGLRAGRELLFSAVNTSSEAMQAIVDGRLTALAGGHFLAGAWALVMLHDLHHGRDFASEGLQLQRPMFMLFDKAAARQMLARGGALPATDFCAYSKACNPKLKRYRFDPAALLALR